MNFDLTGFACGFGGVLTAFFFSWAIGLAGKMLDVGGE